ncbi:MAG: PhzF family phenazine biosynthesis protein [Anaerolineae bacterium]|nr:PhzF family phenazine biosynthesis protein [Anaerolineae bacterium]
MRKFVFKKIDAFATRESEGNPAAAIYLDAEHDISVHEMQRIAQELEGFVSEVGYVRQLDENTFDLKYYSSEREVDFCGHATIAIMHDLLKNNAELIKKRLLNIVTSKGRLVVENRIAQEDAVYISAPSPSFSSREIAEEHLAKALRISTDIISVAYPTSIVNAGLETLVVPINTLQAVLTIAPHFEALKLFCQENSIDIITVFTDEVADKANAYRTRVFAPTFGYLEDPATGSGNAAFGYYLLENNRWDGKPISLEQNGDYANPNIVKLLAKHDERNEVHVVFGGGAIVRIAGEYFLA